MSARPDGPADAADVRLNFDHRVLDGLQAARFLTSCRKWLESIERDTPIY